MTRVGIGPIGWANDDIRAWGRGTPGETIMRQMAELGFEGSEMSYTFPQDPSELREALDRYGLRLAGAYRWTNFVYQELVEQEIETAKAHVDFCKAAGARYANLAEGGHSLHWDRHGPQDCVTPLTDDEWDRLQSALHAVGRYARDQEIVLSVHPHGGTAIETEAQIDRLFGSTDPDLVGYCLDTGHIAYGGGDPGRVAARWCDRVRYLHLKDVRLEVLQRVQAEGLTFVQAVMAGVFCGPGAGDLDFAPVLMALQAAGYQGWYIVEAEQDPQAHDPVEVGRRARAFLRQRYGL
ncbi:MAG TPA: myo-inosose-2 dehydratase [Trueperaceae bacterium]